MLFEMTCEDAGPGEEPVMCAFDAPPRRSLPGAERARYGVPPSIVSVSATGVTLSGSPTVAFEVRVACADGVRSVDALVEFSDDARALLQAAAWRDGRTIPDLLRAVASESMRRHGGAVASAARYTLHVPTADVRRAIVAGARPSAA